MNDEIFNKTIKIASKEEAKTRSGTNTRIKLVDHEGKKFVFNKLKSDQSKSQAYQQFVDMRLDEGSVVNIGFVLNTYEIESKSITENKIISFREADGLDTVNIPSEEKTSNAGHSVASEGQPDDYWDKKAYKQCLWGYFLGNVSNNDPQDLNQAQADIVWRNFRFIEADAEKRFAKGWSKAEQIFKEELPTIEQGPDEVNYGSGEFAKEDDLARDIPF